MVQYLTNLKEEYDFNDIPDEVLPFVIKNPRILHVAKVRGIWNEYKYFKDDNMILTPAFPRGNVEADIMIVGQNPGGRGHDKARYTTVWNDGPNSKFILSCVKEAGIFEDTWFTNLVPFPTHDNRITKDQIEKTKVLFNLQINHINPKVFIGLGKVVSHALKDNIFDIPVIEAAHPAYVRRFLSGDPKNREKYIETLASAKTYVNMC